MPAAAEGWHPARIKIVTVDVDNLNTRIYRSAHRSRPNKIPKRVDRMF